MKNSWLVWNNTLFCKKASWVRGSLVWWWWSSPRFCKTQGVISICSSVHCSMSCKIISNFSAVVEHLSKYLWNHLFSLFEFLSIFRLEVSQTTSWPMHLLFLESRSYLFYLFTQITKRKPLLNNFINVPFWLFFYKARFPVFSLFSWLFSDAWWITNYFLNEAIISNFFIYPIAPEYIK